LPDSSSRRRSSRSRSAIRSFSAAGSSTTAGRGEPGDDARARASHVALGQRADDTKFSSPIV
jgi:hypothetical protein